MPVRPWILTLLACVLLLQGGARAAVPPCLSVVTPQAQATDVPLDTRIVLEVSETDAQPAPQLFAVESGKEVPLKLEAAQHSGRPAWWTPPPPGWVGPVHTSGTYTFQPLEQLEPRTRYEVRCGRAYACGKGRCPVTFTTGTARAKRPSPKPSPTH